MSSRPDSHSKPAAGAATKVAKALPWALRHIEQ
jgi:hypothetical protein